VFELARERLGVRAEEAVFVGDDLRWDVAGARGAGMEAVLIDRAGRPAPDGLNPIRRLGELWPCLGEEPPLQGGPTA
jgi:FMN phosphatase YigB (HAD superfamily)